MTTAKVQHAGMWCELEQTPDDACCCVTRLLRQPWEVEVQIVLVKQFVGGPLIGHPLNLLTLQRTEAPEFLVGLGRAYDVIARTGMGSADHPPAVPHNAGWSALSPIVGVGTARGPDR